MWIFCICRCKNMSKMTQPSSKMTSEIPHAKQLTSAAVWPKLEQCFQRHDLTCPVSGKTQFWWVSAHCGTCGSSASAVAKTCQEWRNLLHKNDATLFKNDVRNSTAVCQKFFRKWCNNFQHLLKNMLPPSPIRILGASHCKVGFCSSLWRKFFWKLHLTCKDLCARLAESLSMRLRNKASILLV